MKKILFTLIAVTTITFAASAQKEFKKEGKAHHGNHHNKHDKGMMMKELNLSDAQKQQMKTNHEAFKKQMHDLNKNESITVKEQRDRKDALKKEYKSKKMALLTPDQKVKMEQIKKDKKAQHELRSAQKMEKMKTNLGLNDDQVAKIKADKEAIHAKKQAIKDNEKLSRTEREQQLKAIKEQHKDGIKKYLTADQVKKYEASKKNKGDRKAS